MAETFINVPEKQLPSRDREGDSARLSASLGMTLSLAGHQVCFLHLPPSPNGVVFANGTHGLLGQPGINAVLVKGVPAGNGAHGVVHLEGFQTNGAG